MRFAVSIWTSWAIVTVGSLATARGMGYSDQWNYGPYHLFNLFTPVLVGNLDKWQLTLPLLFGGLLLGDFLGRKFKRPVLRLFFNLGVLFALTVAADMICWQRPSSLDDFVIACDRLTRSAPPYCPTIEQTRK